MATESLNSFTDRFASACDAKINELRDQAKHIYANDPKRRQMADRLIEISNDIEIAKRMLFRFQEEGIIEY
jgi:hypothetical protein